MLVDGKVYKSKMAPLVYDNVFVGMDVIIR
ncbi:MAG: hypothetical protein RLZZ211_1947 [Bacteroidota bacterium]|jgi:hypothetical protein